MTGLRHSQVLSGCCRGNRLADEVGIRETRAELISRWGMMGERSARVRSYTPLNSGRS